VPDKYNEMMNRMQYVLLHVHELTRQQDGLHAKDYEAQYVLLHVHELTRQQDGLHAKDYEAVKAEACCCHSRPSCRGFVSLAPLQSEQDTRHTTISIIGVLTYT